MTRHLRCQLWPFAGLVLFLLVCRGVDGAQDRAAGERNPFGDEAAPAKPAAVADKGKTAKPMDPEQATDPLVRAILLLKPTRAEDQFRAALSLQRLRHPELAKQFLKQLLDAKYDAATLAGLHRLFGPAVLSSMMKEEALQPEGTAVANAILRSAIEQGQDPKRIDALVQQLGDAQPARRRLALVQLARIGTPAVGALLRALVQPTSPEQQTTVRKTLVAIGAEAIPLLVASMESSDAKLRLQVIDVLGLSKAKSAVPALLLPALDPNGDTLERQAAERALKAILGGLVTREQAIAFLQRRLDTYLSGFDPVEPNGQERVAIWTWDSKSGIPARQMVSRSDASIESAARIAGQLHLLAPDDAARLPIYLATTLEVAQRRAGFDHALDKNGSVLKELATVKVSVLQDVLQLARKRHFHGAAISLLNWFGKQGDRQLFDSGGQQPGILVQALLDHDRRVQFNAAQAVVALDPQTAYPGSSYLPETLAYLASSSGDQRALIGHPRTEIARTYAGLLNQLGLEAETANYGRDVILKATDDPDLAVILIVDTITRPAYRDLLQALRRDPHTSELPVGLIVRDLTQSKYSRLAELDRLTIPMASPITEADMALELRRLFQRGGRQRLSQDERLRQAEFALETLTSWAEHPDRYGFYELIPQQASIIKALGDSPLSSKAARLLGLLATPQAQLALTDFARETARPLASRKAAAEAFRVAVGRRHLLLTRPQIMQQYESYNASENLDRDTQQILASILDAIESPVRKRNHKQEKKEP